MSEVKIRPSIFKPLVVEIGDKKFVVRRVSRKEQNEVLKFDEKIRAGDLDAYYKRLEYLLELEKSDPAIDKLSTQEVDEITNGLITKLYSPKAEDISHQDAGKNSPGSGKKKP